MWRGIARFGVALAFVLLVGFPGSSDLRAQVKTTTEEDRGDIQGILKAQQAAWNKGDIEAFVTGYWKSPELTFSGADGVQRGYDAVLARYKRSYPDKAAMGNLDFSDLEFHFLGKDAALVLGRWHLIREKDAPGGVFSLVWQRFPEGWKIIHDHTSLVKAEK